MPTKTRLNSIWQTTSGAKGYPWKDTYLDRIMLHYGVGIETLDFQGEPDASQVIINDFIARLHPRQNQGPLATRLHQEGHRGCPNQSISRRLGPMLSTRMQPQTKPSPTWTVRRLRRAHVADGVRRHEDEQVQALELDYANNSRWSSLCRKASFPTLRAR